jgi:hypothetical protein
VRISAAGAFVDPGDGFIVLQTTNGLRIRSQVGSTWKPLEAGSTAVHGTLTVDTGAALTAPVTVLGNGASVTGDASLTVGADAAEIGLRVLGPGTAGAAVELKPGSGGAAWRFVSHGAGDAGWGSGGQLELRDQTAGIAQSDGTLSNTGAVSSFTGERTLFRFMNGTEPVLDMTAQGRVGIGDTTPEEALDVEGNLTMNNNEIKSFRVHRSSGAPFACDAAHAGAMYFDTGTKRFYGCDGTQLVALAAPGQSAGSDIPGTSVASAARSCVEVRDGGGLSSGQYWIDPTGGDHWDAFLGYCDQETNGGGWLLLSNSVGSDLGTTLSFWQMPYAHRFVRKGEAAPMENYYNGELYKYGQEYLDLAWDLAGTKGVLMQASATGIDTVTMKMQSPAFIAGSGSAYGAHFAAGWGSHDADYDTYSGHCAASYGNVMQHYSECWNYNLGSDADSSGGTEADQGWGPHMSAGLANGVFPSGGLQDGSAYTRVRRIARFVRWDSANGNSPVNPAESCQAIKDTDAGAPSGVYWVDPNGGSTADAFQVYCEQALNGGGWALLFNSVSQKNTMAFWQVPYSQRLSIRGIPAPTENYTNPTLYTLGTTYMDVFWDLADTSGVAFVATATGIDTTTMKMQSPSMTSGALSGAYSCHFAAGWASYDADYDEQPGANCATSYSNVMQHYCGCWNYNLGSDADNSPGGTIADNGWGPHVYTGYLQTAISGASHDGSTYSRVNRIARFVKW